MLIPLITQIQRFSLQDGPGIRTTVFLKGCPLRCPWCHNPEAMSPTQEINFHEAKCEACGLCTQVCPSGALTLDQASGNGPVRVFDRSKCILCLRCIDACPAGALEVAGKYADIDGIVEEALADKIFYDNSGGGVTISGGEPLLFPEFTLELVRRLKGKENVHIAVETSCFAKWDKIAALLEFVDLFIVDIKTMDPQKHRDVIGGSLQDILSNIAMLIQSNANVRIHLPIIPGFNNSASDFKYYVDYLGQFADKISGVDILPYHSYGTKKYSNLGRQYQYEGVEDLPAKQVMPLAAALKRKRLQVTIGGLIGTTRPQDDLQK